MKQILIPKIVHYCWFGGKEKPNNIKKCLNTWRKYLPDYKFIEWNESNFDINKLKYTKEAYNAKKYAFVSDVARIEALKQYGGIYMDTDVEVLKSFNDILANKCILGFEEGNYIATSFMAAIPNHQLVQQFVDLYKNLDFFTTDGYINKESNVMKLTSLLVDNGLVRDNKYQVLNDNITIFPKEYFSPYNYINCYCRITSTSYCVHRFYASMEPWSNKIKKNIKWIISNTIGTKYLNTLRRKMK